MTQEEVMASVEKMLQNEKQVIKATPKVQAAAEFDLNEGVVSTSRVVPASTATTGGAKKDERQSIANAAV
jgi:hypothetical protein